MRGRIHLIKPALHCFSLVLMLSCLFFSTHSYGQKIYANSQTNQVNGLCLLCGVTNPNNPVDSTSLDDYSTFTITLGLLGVSVQQTLIFPAPSVTGCDSLIVGIGSSNSIISLDLFGGVTVQTFNGATANNDAQVVSASILTLLDNGTRAAILLKPTQQFDRVQLTLTSNLVGLLNGFRLYYAYYQASVPPPVVSGPASICNGSTISLTATGSNITWYNAATAGTLLFTGSPYNVSPSATTNYYAQAADNSGCTSTRALTTVTVNPLPAIPTLQADTVTICAGDSAVLSAIAPANVTFRWYYNATGGSPVVTGNTITLYNQPETATFYVDALDNNGCVSSARQPVTVVVNLKPSTPTVANDTIIITLGDTARLQVTGPFGAGVSFRWYYTATGGTPLSSNNPYLVTPTVDTTYYVSAVVNGLCESARTAVTVIVNPVSCAQAPATPFGYYPLNGNALDYSPAANNGTPIGTITYAIDSICYKAAIFNGSGGIQLPNVVLPTSAITVSAWVNLASAADLSGLVSSSDGTAGWVLTTTSGKFAFGLNTVNNGPVEFISPNTFSLNQWYHLVGTYDGTTVTLYINGVVAVSGALSGNLVYPSSTGNYKIGQFDGITAITGRMDEVYIYNRALSATEVSNFYNSYDYSSIVVARKRNTAATVKPPVENNNSSKLSFYPNPTTGLIQILNKEDLSGSIAIVSNLQGKMLYQITLTTNSIQLPVSLSMGTYLIRLRTKAGKIITGKVVLNRP
jgi:hypothetical protein